MFSNAQKITDAPPAVSVYQRALGAEFAELSPRLQNYFGPIPTGWTGVGEGVYREAGLRARWLRPAFHLLARLHIAFAERETDVPFHIRNHVGDGGALHAERTFDFAAHRHTMLDAICERNGALVDRVGLGGIVEVELIARVRSGGLHLRSHRLALRLGRLRVPLPPVMTIDLTERAMPNDRQQVDVRLRMPLIGEVYGYAGTFTYALYPTGGAALTLR